MITRLARVTVIVRDHDEALEFYVGKLGLEKRADDAFAPGMRWVTVAPKDQNEVEIVLQKPGGSWHDEEETKRLLSRVGQGTTWVFFTDDCRTTYEELKSKGVSFIYPPAEQMYGVEAIFEDLYGNVFSLLQPR